MQNFDDRGLPKCPRRTYAPPSISGRRPETENTFVQFLTVIEKTYLRDNPYHNNTHGARVRLTNVSHYKGEYTKTVLNRARGQAALAGTQSIDSRWRWLKKYVPHSVKARAPKGCPNPVNPLLDEYVYSWQWRTNCKAAGKSLWLQLGEEVFKA